MAKTVWILGSGFSKALGGPLLLDLLSDRSGSEAKGRLTELASHYTRMDLLMGDLKPGEQVPDLGLVYKVFSEHLRGSDASQGQAVHWEHAEEYLTFVDSTSGDSARREILKQWLPNEYKTDDGVGVFRRMVVKAIAAECMFAETASVKTDEVWSPYISWGKRLDANRDSIITFNYDTVLEKLGDSKQAPLISRKGVAEPSAQPESGYVPIYKLHGSVDWFFNSNGETSRRDNFLRAINGGLSPLMGTPGISKRTVRDTFLDKLWKQAEDALKQADVIVFLGYRSPPSDPDARTFILNAISTAYGIGHAARHRRVHLVLGPNTSDPAVTRLEKLIDFSMAPQGRIKRRTLGFDRNHPKYEVVKQPLYVEDFLSAYHDTELHGTHPEDD